METTQSTQPTVNQPLRSATLPSDLRSRISRCYVDDREFKDPDTGRVVKYSKLVIEFVIDGDIVEYGVTVQKKDKLLLKLADDFSSGRPF